MKKSRILIVVLAIALVHTAKGQSNDMFTFVNVKKAKIVEFELENYPWVQTVDTVLPGQFILKTDPDEKEKKLSLEIPTKKHNAAETKMYARVISTSIDLQQNVLIIELDEVNHCNFSALGVLVLKLDGEDMGYVRLLIARFRSL